MTNVATRPDGAGGDDSAGADAHSTMVIPPRPPLPGETPAGPAEHGDVQWAEAEPRKKRHLGLWLGIGIPVGLIAAAAGAAAAVLIAPGVTAAGAPVGFSTEGNAAATIAAHLEDRRFAIGDATVTGSDLGLSVDAKALAEQAFSTYPAWNLGAWGNGRVDGAVSIDAEKAAETLRGAVPELYSDSVDAQVVFDADAGRYTVVEATSGEGVDVDALAASITEALAKHPDPADTITVEPQETEVEAAATTEEAQAFAASLNDQLAADSAQAAGFYLQDELALALPAADIQGWMDITADPESGDFVVTPDMGAIEEAIKDLPARVNNDVVNEEVVVNSAGDKLHVLKEGQDGFGIETTDGVSDAIAASLQSGDLSFDLQGEVVKFETVTHFRRAEVDKSAGTAYFYEGPAAGQEALVASYPIALGKPGHDTKTGHFTVYGQLTSQNMGSCDAEGNYVPGGKFDYCTANVPFVTYFNGDQGFHGTYWHNSFGAGNYLSHGCVNMTQTAAEWTYRFLQVGSEVWVHD